MIGGLLINGSIVITAQKHLLKNDDPLPSVECIIVFGAKVRGEKLSFVLEDRVNEAYRLWQKNPALKIIVSGDHGRKNYDEVNAMRLNLENKGVPSNLIFMDHAGFNSYETLYRAKAIFGVNSAILISQKYHLPRTLFIANNFKIKAYGSPADHHNYEIYKYQFELREIIARVKDFAVVTIVKPLPKFLGEPIPIQTSSGLVTHDKK